MVENKLLVVGFMLMMKPNITSERGQKNNDLTRARKQQLKEKLQTLEIIVLLFNKRQDEQQQQQHENRKLFKL